MHPDRAPPRLPALRGAVPARVRGGDRVAVRAHWPEAWDRTLLYLLPLPVTLEFVIERFGGIRYQAGRQIALTLLAAPALGRGLARYWRARRRSPVLGDGAAIRRQRAVRAVLRRPAALDRRSILTVDVDRDRRRLHLRRLDHAQHLARRIDGQTRRNRARRGTGRRPRRTVIGCGEMIVTVLLCAGIVPGTMNCLQVIDEIQETRSTRSVFGLRFSLRRLPGGQPAARIAGSAERTAGAARTLGRARCCWRRQDRGQQQQRGELPPHACMNKQARDHARNRGAPRESPRHVLRVRQFGARRWRRDVLSSAYNRGRVTRSLPAPIRRALWGLAWAVTALLATVVVMRLVWHDGLWLFLLCNIVTPYLYLPAWLIMPCAVLARRWRLTAASLAIVAFHCHWVLLPLLPRTPPTTTGRTLRIASANLLVVNETPAELAAELERFDADIYFLQELSRRLGRRIRTARLLAPLPVQPAHHRRGRVRRGDRVAASGARSRGVLERRAAAAARACCASTIATSMS